MPPYGGVDPEAAFSKANAAIKAMVNDYIDELGRDIDRLMQLVKRYKAEPCRETITPIYKIVHNMRGQGSTFNYPLVTQIGKSLCQYCIELPDGNQTNPELVLDHILALKLVHTKHLEGQGDDLSQAVALGLQQAVEMEISRSNGADHFAGNRQRH